MNKICLSAFLLLFISFGYSQEQKPRFGVHAGANYSNVRGLHEIIDNSPGFGYAAGVSYEHPLNERLSLRADLNYERKVYVTHFAFELIGNWDDPGAFYEGKITLHFNYVVLPVLLKYNLNNNSAYLLGGVYAAYLFKAGMKNDLNIPEIPEKEDTTASYNSIDAGLVFGIGKNFKLGTSHEIYVELRENLGLANIVKNPATDGVRMNSINLLLGYRL